MTLLWAMLVWAKPPKADEEPGVALDLGPRSPAELSIHADTLDNARQEVLRAEVERFRPCLEVYRAPRGHAGGTFSLGGRIGTDGAFLGSEVMSSVYTAATERCLADAAASLRFPPTGLDVEVGLVASVRVDDPSTRRRDGEVRGRWAPDDRLEPPVAFRTLSAEGAGAAWVDALRRSEGALSDCVWHAAPEVPVSAGGVLGVTRDEEGLRARLSEVHGDEASLGECLGRLLSTLPLEGMGAARVSVVAGPGGGALGSP